MPESNKWQSALSHADAQYQCYVDENPEDHMRFPEYAYHYHNIPVLVAKEYWGNV